MDKCLKCGEAIPTGDILCNACLEWAHRSRHQWQRVEQESAGYHYWTAGPYKRDPKRPPWVEAEFAARGGPRGEG